MKTNVMRILDQHKIAYKVHDYSKSGAISGLDVVAVLNQSAAKVFKTLVTVSKSGNHYVFVIPVNKELDLKKAAKAVNEKAITMIKSKDLQLLTGYVHGGCSPLGMKKSFSTVIDESVNKLETFCFNGGKIGYQVELNITDLRKALNFSVADIAL
ncbi:Cys-tRNA(Pro) deacylase [Erysipelotrichaceae bacterium OttesenSCG-928-M19]|nr:Cys-tRNA(Pro) deacylase [Erysipelotrichaceae bacterium OttesenSCG-928-M19]